MKTRTFLPIVAVLFAAFTLPTQTFAQSTNVKTRNKNQSAKFKSAIFKGSGNLIQSNSVTSFIGAGQSNSVLSGADYAVLGGGFGNLINNDYGTVSGGGGNTASGAVATVAGGEGNTASGVWSTVAGGRANTASGNYATIGGGRQNTNNGSYSTIGGGLENAAANVYSTVAGGANNRADGLTSTIGGGALNTNSGERSTIGGGISNTITANAGQATVPGGSQNTASSNYTFAAGTRAKATNDNSFVWGGDDSEDTQSFAAKTFTVRCEGGARFYTANGTSTGVSIAGGSGTWTSLSDRSAKENFQDVDAGEVLAKVAAMPIKTWNYKTQAESIRHIGPTAQDFKVAFGVGESDTGITTVDADGVALAAIKGLVEELKERDAKIEKLESKLQAVEERLNSLPPQ